MRRLLFFYLTESGHEGTSWLQVDEGQSGLVATSNEKVASVPVKIARLAMNTIN